MQCCVFVYVCVYLAGWGWESRTLWEPLSIGNCRAAHPAGSPGFQSHSIPVSICMWVI